MTVSDWMTPAPHTVSPSTTLFEVRKLFRSYRFRHVPVVADGRIVGVISDRDVLAASSPFEDQPGQTWRDANTLMQEAERLMTPNPETIAASAPLSDAARRMVERNVSSLLAVDADGGLVGILTARDVLRASSGR